MKNKYNFEKLKKHYEQKGWVLLNNFIKYEDTLKIKKLIRDYIKKRLLNKNNSRSLNFIGNTKNINNLNSFHELGKNSLIKKIANSTYIKNIVKKFLNSQAEYRFSELFAKPAKKGLPSPAHQDNYYWGVKGSNALTIWIALDKSNIKNGCIYYYDGSHKHGILSHKPSYAKGSSQTVKNKRFLKKFKISYPSLKIGDALIHHSLIVHGSLANKSKNSRKEWTLQFKDKKAHYEKKQIKNYEKS
jgi:Protein involved in biosynthesis of mitomycin antibiotics/polyketide fumonisin